MSVAATKKIMVLGEIGVGKTSLVRRLVLDEFGADYLATIGVDIYEYASPASQRNANPTSMILWDTDGDLGESILEHIYCRGATAALVVSDITRPGTVEHAAGLAARFEQRFPGRPAMVVRNKRDLLPTGELPVPVPAGLVTDDDRAGEGLASADTSAKTGAGVTDALSRLAAIIARRGL